MRYCEGSKQSPSYVLRKVLGELIQEGNGPHGAVEVAPKPGRKTELNRRQHCSHPDCRAFVHDRASAAAIPQQAARDCAARRCPPAGLCGDRHRRAAPRPFHPGNFQVPASRFFRRSRRRIWRWRDIAGRRRHDMPSRCISDDLSVGLVGYPPRKSGTGRRSGTSASQKAFHSASVIRFSSIRSWTIAIDTNCAVSSLALAIKTSRHCSSVASAGCNRCSP